MSNVINLSCTCGTVKGKVKVVDGSFLRIHCLCCDCQSYASYLGNEEKILDEHGGTDLFQTYPSNMEITEGKESIGCVQLREKGAYRWHTTCCNMPLANTLTSPKIPFVAVPVKLMQLDNNQDKLSVIGPVKMKAFGQYARGKMPQDAHPKIPLSILPKLLGFMFRGLLGKKHTPSPFFRDREPVVKANVL